MCLEAWPVGTPGRYVSVAIKAKKLRGGGARFLLLVAMGSFSNEFVIRKIMTCTCIPLDIIRSVNPVNVSILQRYDERTADFT